MTSAFQSDSLLVRYILGKASPEECRDLEARYLADADLLEEMVAVENDLIDAYAAGELSGPDRRRFEEHFLVTAERRQRVAFAEALLDQVSAESAGTEEKVAGPPGFLPPGTPPNRWPAALQFGVAALLLAIVAGALWTTMQIVRLRGDVDQLRTGTAELQGKERQLQQQIEALSGKNAPNGKRDGQEQAGKKQPAASSPLAVLTLHADISRSSGTQNNLILFPGTRFVRLHLGLEQYDSPTFGASLETPDKTVVWQAKALAVRAGQPEAFVDVTLPAKLLQSGDYIVNLTAEAPSGRSEIVNSYIFQVSRR
jgi:hypothetical protein